MARLGLIFTILLGFHFSFAQALIDREQKSIEAGKEWLSTHFFENGRGMTLSPDLSVFFGGLNKQPSLFQDPFITKKFGFLPGSNNVMSASSKLSTKAWTWRFWAARPVTPAGPQGY
jgi:hypothetical protein